MLWHRYKDDPATKSVRGVIVTPRSISLPDRQSWPERVEL